MAENSNSTLEMGTSDQVLVSSKKKKNLTMILGFVGVLVVIGVVVALVVLLSGGDGGDAEAIVSTTEGPTPVTTIDPGTTVTPETTVPTTQAPDSGEPIDLETIISGAFTPPSFSGTWSSGNEFVYQNEFGDLLKFDVETNSSELLISNSSQILQDSSRVQLLSPEGDHVMLAHRVTPVYRYSFLARYTAIEISTGLEINIVPPSSTGTRDDAAEPFLQNLVWGPSQNSLAYVYLNNIYYQSSLTAAPLQITTNGLADVIYNGIPDWVYEEEVFGSSNALWFSGDGSRLAYATFDDTDVRIMHVPHFGVPGSIDYQYTRHHEIRYPKSGTRNPSVSVTLRELTSTVSNVYTAPADLNEPILKNVRFVTSQTIALMWTNRVQTALKVVLCTQGQNTCSQIFEYTEANGWIDNIPLMFNEAGNAFITILPQLVDGVGYKQIVQVSEAAGAWTLQNRVNTAHTVAEILLWTSADLIWYKATHVRDSAEQHIYSVNAAGVVSCFTCEIVREDGGQCLYNDGAVSTDGSRITVNCAGPDVPQIFLYDSSGQLMRVWDDSAEISSLLSGAALPLTIRMSVPVAAGLPDADVDIRVPANYQTQTNMPLLVYVYGGPDSALVTKQWSVDWATSLVSRWGIAVAQIDGRGSGLRGTANMFSINRRLGSYEIEDQISVTRYLHENLPWLGGSNRTCIWGWSYGGYAASLALARGGDVFRCAVAVAPVVDWRFYDTIYTERYMDTPQNNPEGYVSSSLLSADVVTAFREKSYFLIHGTADDNVHYQHAMLISRLLQRSNVQFTQMSYTDEDHGLVGVRPHLYHGIEKFLEENMF